MYELYRRADYKQLITVRCPDGMTKEKLKEWFFAHAEKMRLLPGITWYTLLFSLDGSPFGEPAFDACEELWFGSLPDLQSAYNTEIMQAELNEMKEKGLDDPSRFQGVWMEENVVEMKGFEEIPRRRGAVRLVGICRQPPEMTRKALKDWFYQHANAVIGKEGKMIIPGIRWYSHSFVIKESPFKPVPFDGCAENWWDSLAEMKRDFDGEVMKSQLKDREDNIDVVDPSYFQGVWADEYIIDLPV